MRKRPFRYAQALALLVLGLAFMSKCPKRCSTECGFSPTRFPIRPNTDWMRVLPFIPHPHRMRLTRRSQALSCPAQQQNAAHPAIHLKPSIPAILSIHRSHPAIPASKTRASTCHIWRLIVVFDERWFSDFIARPRSYLPCFTLYPELWGLNPPLQVKYRTFVFQSAIGSSTGGS